MGLTGASHAKAINDKGDIVGYAKTAAGYNRGFLLRPFPTLFTHPSGTGLVVSWFTNARATVSLFQTTKLAVVNWAAVMNTPSVANDQKQVVISGPLAGSRYYWLKSQ